MKVKQLLLDLNPHHRFGVYRQDSGLTNETLLMMGDIVNELDEFKHSTVEIIKVKFDTPTVTYNEDGFPTVTNTSDPEIISVMDDDQFRFAENVKLHSIFLSNHATKEEVKVIYRLTPDSIIPLDKWRNDRLDKIL
ncbi:MAG: hypothetical protein SLAVMIC_00317 [uncultured marine phage]|uniref:Uncharacterized protein n=1 Tax=uncultured marine phage TaxID=707152 RepID=A0A8D9CC16_9VIRU|nr:MAG: hypothetical protein SLAVMIC_00317 [uncultured marine phage]